MAQRTARARGFSLIEVVVILAVLAIFAAIAVPNYLRWQANEQVKSAARTVADSFHLARSESLRTGNNFLVVLDGGLGAPAPIVVVDDGPQATADCTIDPDEIIHTSELGRDTVFGTGPAGAALAPDDEGGIPANSATGSTFSDGGGANPASWVLFQSDGMPRTFSNAGSTCSAIGAAAAGGGGIYLSNGDRDYSIVLRPLGTTRVHRWRGADGWSS